MTDVPSSPVSHPAFWQDLYARGSDRWELGGPAPPLVEYLARAASPAPAATATAGPASPACWPRGGAVAIPGCGRGHDARFLARTGYRVWGFDFVPGVVEEARALARRQGRDVVFESRDVFGLAEDYAGFFDGVWEYTCYCAIDPARRDEYVRLLRRILKPGGWLLACFFPLREGTAGPPFPTTEAEIRQRLAPHFTIADRHVPATSAEGRRGLELVIAAQALAGASSEGG